MKKQAVETLLIHGGDVEGDETRGIAPPIHMSSSYSFETIEHAEKVMGFESSDYVYTRGNNPTLRLFENRMAELEGGNAAVAFSSGMAAISSVLFSLLEPGDEVLAHKTLYGSSYSVVTKLLPKYNVSSLLTDLTDLDSVKNAFAGKSGSNIKVVFFESPANPTLSIIDIAAVSEIAHTYGAKVVVDNTFATPYLQNPLKLGADIVVHSATKYICGHGDALGGAAVTIDQEYGFKLKFDYMCEFGGVMSPFNAWLMIRGLKTLGIRMDRHTENAAKMASFLENHKKITRVFYPGLPSHNQFSLASSQMRSGGGMISFEVSGGLVKAKQFINNLKMIKTAVSLGDCESLIQLPAAITHRGYSREKLKQFGLTESMIRLSVGLEHIDDIISDISQALEIM
ncbi:MAG: PLP-dependent transferase [Bacteroidetes bacterium]|nr:PLP-dependent transferase [Bacteroidota bacterium]